MNNTRRPEVIIKALTLFSGLLIMFHANAENILPIINKRMPYEDVKKTLIADGWEPLNNLKISQSSLYAQELYGQGMTEVVDCISMELDGCRFYYTKKNRTLEVRTITRQLTLEKLNILKNR
jgi:hypothetical protein